MLSIATCLAPFLVCFINWRPGSEECNKAEFKYILIHRIKLRGTLIYIQLFLQAVLIHGLHRKIMDLSFLAKVKSRYSVLIIDPSTHTPFYILTNCVRKIHTLSKHSRKKLDSERCKFGPIICLFLKQIIFAPKI